MGNRIICRLKRVAALMGDARLDAPPQLVRNLQKALRNAKIDVKGRQLAEALSKGEVHVIIKQIKDKMKGSVHDRAELAEKLQGILDSRPGEAVGQFPRKDAGISGGAERNGPGHEGSPDGTQTGPGPLGERGATEGGPNTVQETARALRDRTGPLGGRGGEQPAVGGQADRFFINFSRIDAPEDVKTVLQNMADGYRAEIDSARRGVRSFEQTALSAEQENAWKLLAERRAGQPLNAEQSLAARNLWASSGQKLSELADLAVNAPTKENLFAFRKMVEVHRAIQNEVIAARTETARALGAWRIPAGPRALQLRYMEDMLGRIPGGQKTVLELADKVAKLSASGQAQALEMLIEKSPWAITRDGAGASPAPLGRR